VTPQHASDRDDGPLAQALRRLAPRRLRPVGTMLTSCAVLAVGLAVDGTRTTTGSVLGVCGFALLGALSGGGRSDGRLRWVVSPLLRTGEYATLIVLAWRAGMLPVAFALLAVVTSHHYDLAYRRETAPARRVDLLAGGWEGRTLLLTAASLAGVFGGACIALAVWIAVLVVVSAARQVRTLVRDGRAP
jgi:hypothetical protein